MLNSIDESNLEALKEIIEDDLKEILLNFIETSPEMIQKIKLSLQSGDAESLRLHAHSLRGSCANVGAINLPNLCSVLEDKGRDGVTENLEAKLLAVELELSQVNTFLQKYIASAF